MIRIIKEVSLLTKIKNLRSSPFFIPYLMLLIVVLSIPVSLVLLSNRLNFSQKAAPPPATSTDGTWYLNDVEAGSWNNIHEMYCSTSTNCQLVYPDATNGTLKFILCHDATCTNNTINVIDGIPSCPLTNCIDTFGHTSAVSYIQMYCLAADDCKIVYQYVVNPFDPPPDPNAGGLIFIDCDNDTCTTGTRNQLAGPGCPLTNCVPFGRPSIFCNATDDCKIAATANDGVGFIDCNNTTCTSGTVTMVDNDLNCTLTNCNTDLLINPTWGTPSLVPSSDIYIYCLTSNDCKLAYSIDLVATCGWNCTSHMMRFADCDASDCSTGTATTIEGQPGCTLTGCTAFTNDPEPQNSAPADLFCISTDDCKLIYIVSQRNPDFTGLPSGLMYADCDNSTCSVGTTNLVDGYRLNNTCNVTNCNADINSISYPTLFCSASDDCKIVYENLTKQLSLRMIDCNNTTCTSGVLNNIDGAPNCTLTHCLDTNIFEWYPSIFCVSSTDCKIKYYEWAGTNVWLADCDNTDCTSGSTRYLDGNFMSKTQGTRPNYADYFGKYDNPNEITRYWTVTGNTYPEAGFSYLGAGTYHFRWYFQNRSAPGEPMTWQFTVGYCSIALNCDDKVPVATSAPMLLDGDTIAPIDVYATASAGLTIPGPDNSKWVYFDAQILNTVNFPFIFPYANSTEGDFANTFLEIPFEAAPTPTDTPTPTPTDTPTPTPTDTPTPTPTDTPTPTPTDTPTPTPTLPPGVTPTDTPIPTPTDTPTPTPTDTPTPTPTNTPTPTDTPTPTPTNTPTPTPLPVTACSFTGPTSLNVGQTGTFTSTSTGTIASYVWTASSGTPTTGIASSFTWSSTLAGSYTITLTITDTLDRSYSCATTVNVVVPVANTPTPVIVIPKGPPRTGIKI